MFTEKPGKRIRKLQICLTTEELEALRRRADETGLPMGSIIRSAIKQLLSLSTRKLASGE